MKQNFCLTRYQFPAECSVQNQVILPLPLQIHDVSATMLERISQVFLYLILQRVQKSFFANFIFRFILKTIIFSHDSSGVCCDLYICCVSNGKI